MKARLLSFSLLVFVLVGIRLVCPMFSGAQDTATRKSALVERVGDTGFIRVEADSFKNLGEKQKELAFWLTQASIAIDPIVYAQFSWFGLRQKRLLEEVLAHSEGLNSEVKGRIAAFAKLFWGNRGNHNEVTSQKFLPAFTFEELKDAAETAQKNGAFKTKYGDLPPLTNAAELDKELEALRPSLFDANFQPMLTAKTPRGGQDIIQASSNTFYQNINLADLANFHGSHPLNSRVVKDQNANLYEQVYRAGTPDGKVPPGLYALYLKRANEYLARAQQVADPAQAKVIGDLIRYYQTGDFKDWLQFGTDWVQNDATVDFVSGFVEVYRDANAMKGSSQSFVSVTNQKMTETMNKLAANAAYFEEKAPWDAKYKKQTFKPPVIKAIETIIETGDFGVTTIGDNLPNENEIHEKYGSKNFLFTSSSHALNEVIGDKRTREFAGSSEIVERDIKYGGQAQELLTALHEVIGHGSGKLSERLKGGAESYLKEYFSTLEEARADLMALWNAWDPKLKELGLVSDQDEVAKAMYDGAVHAPLMQLASIPTGNTVEEDHQRDRQLIVEFIRDKVPGSIEESDRNGKTYFEVRDYPKVRQGVGMLLAELMRIKAEGDYAAIKALVDRYGVHFNPALRDQVVARMKSLDIPTYWAGINSQLTGRVGANGQVQDVEISYPHDAVRQYLRYAAMYDESLLPAQEEKRAASNP